MKLYKVYELNIQLKKLEKNNRISPQTFESREKIDDKNGRDN